MYMYSTKLMATLRITWFVQTYKPFEVGWFVYLYIFVSFNVISTCLYNKGIRTWFWFVTMVYNILWNHDTTIYIYLMGEHISCHGYRGERRCVKYTVPQTCFHVGGGRRLRRLILILLVLLAWLPFLSLPCWALFWDQAHCRSKKHNFKIKM